MAYIYKTDKTTGKTYRITVVGLDTTSNPGFTGSREVPTISWNPEALSSSYPLTTDQLNATASVNGTEISGTFTYFDKNGNFITLGTVLPDGNNHAICNFLANDPYKYEDVQSSAIIKVE